MSTLSFDELGDHDLIVNYLMRESQQYLLRQHTFYWAIIYLFIILYILVD